MASSSWVYDVFPTFSWEDVRKTFLHHFLKELDRKLIIAFKDSEIERSHSMTPELKNAIGGSRIAVVVFSEHYASSSRCLDELVEIVKCKEELGQMVIPVFYGLDPSHVRKQTGEFGKLFEETCKSKADDEIQIWRNALTDVANIVGYQTRHWDNEETLIGEIVNDLSDRLGLGPSDDLKVHMTKMSSLLQLKSKEVRMVGIWGPPGIGKSTIARNLFGQHSPHFQNSIFIDRGFVSKSMESYSPTGLDYKMKLHLQKSILSKLLNQKDIKIYHLGAVSERLKLQKCLIFIDDLDDQLVLDALVGQTHWFGSGSRIVVTSTEKHLLTSHGINHTHEVRRPSQELALEIFCRSAFKQNKPPDGFRELASEIALLAGSLPLGLNVLGSSLRGKGKEEWMDMLPRLRNGLNGKIEKTLRTSYEELNNKEQAIFRHIACLFNGEKVDDIKLLLADCELDVNIGLKNLVDKSFLHVRGGTVQMHHLLREMGKEIVRSQSTEPGEREFLVDAKEICNIFEKNSGTEKILGISLNLDEVDELHIDENAFKGMRNLRFLNISQRVKEVRGHTPKCFNYFPPNLTLLRLDGYQMRYLPSTFCPENLVKLQIRGSRLEKLWKGVHPLKRLKIMDLRASKYLKEIPDLSMATSLKTLRLNNCSSLVELPSSIKYLVTLEKLDISFCTNLKTLPTGINLKSLCRLNLRGCSRLRIFPDISTNISYLDLSQTAVEEIPSKLRLNNVDDLYMEDMMNDRLWERVQPLSPVMTMYTLSSSLMGFSPSKIPSLVEHNYYQLSLKGLLKDCEGKKRNEVNFGGHDTKHSEESEECETDGNIVKNPADEKSEVNAKEAQSVRGGKMFYFKSRSGENSIDNKRVDPAKEQNNHEKVSESSTMVTYNKQTSQHQVFINCCGEGVRFSFISHLVYALSTRGVNVFTDKYEKSENLGKTFESIEDSNIALVVFSSRYTESRWCLDELVRIKERMDEEKLLTIPIFYKVELSEVKQLEGDFGLNLWNLWRIQRDHRIIKWKDALESVSTRMGFCLKDHSSESKFITLIAEKILSSISLLEGENPSLLPSSGKIETTKMSTVEGEYYESFLNKCPLVGLEQLMKQLEEKLEFDCNETRIIGVIGMPGIGKTTLATMLYEKWNCKFVRCVPFLGIRKLSENYEPSWLRKTLLEVLFSGKYQIVNEKTTHESLKDKLLQTKVFVVLDDVSNKMQLKYLLDDLSWIKKGSKIVITSCDKSLLEGFVHDTYVVPPLKYGEALQLFSYHAFGDHVFHPTVTSMKLCREFVDCAGGNPLVIKLLGRQLRGRDEAPWEMREGDLTHLGMVILDIFRFGYDLSDPQKDVFLDIACFFRSEDDYFVRSILESGHHDATDGETEVRDLAHMGIISVSGCRVEMHDLLFMFGKIYSSQALIEENGGKRRLWFTQEIIDALVNKKDTESIRGIFLDMADITKTIVLHRLTFMNMLNLRYLKIYDSRCPRPCKAVNKLYFPDGIEFSLEKVRYLHWVKFPLKELPPDFRPENLVDLRLPYSKIERIWKGVKDTPWLKWVDLSHSKNLINLSGLAKAESLQRVNLEGCTNLDELPGEMQNMKSLVYLNLRGCIRLRSLPEMDLISLKTLILSNCSNLKEFRVISKSLKVVHLDGTAIKGLPPSIGNIHSLVLFNMKNCKMLECLPNCLGQLKALEELILSGCSSLKNIPAVRQSMKHVQILLLDETGAKKMPKISCFTGLKGQASVDMLLQPSGSYTSEWQRGFDGVSSLRHLCLSGNDFVSLRIDIGKLYNLTWLDVKRCKKLRSIPMLPPRLQYFDAHGCDSLEKVAHPLALLKMTEQADAVFNFSNCNKLTQEAKDNIISYSRRRSQLMLSALSRYNEGFSSEVLTRTCFPGGEVPEWFSHRGSGSVLEPQLPPQWCDSRFTGIALCAVILFPAYLEQRNYLLVNCNCEFKKEDGSSIHFSFTIGSWKELSNTPREMESSHVFIGYTSRLNINKHGGYDEEGCFCTKSSFEFQVTDGTENVVGCQVLQCGFSLVDATNERENICSDAKTPNRITNQSYGYGFESKGSDLSENKGGEISSRHHNTPSEKSNTKIHDALRCIIDQLNELQKNSLFDLACFFRSEDEYFIRSLLDSGNGDAESEVRYLAEKSLISICDGRVEMNDQLHMFANEVGSPGRLRLWKYTDILDKLREMKSLEDNNVRGIFLDVSEVVQSIAMERMTFINMRNLRYLKIYETCCPRKSKTDCKLQFPDGFDFPLEEVRYFHWLKFPLEELPRDFKPENLVDLRLPYSNVERLWKDVKDTPRLKWVDLSHSSKLLNLSGLAKAESLERLNLEGCTSLDELPRDMQNMKSLVYLNMRGCIRLRSLPQMNLISLKTLILSGCSNLNEFQVISESLEVLHLDGTVIKRLPLAIQKLERLVLLNLKNCKMLECLPNCLGKLKLLEELILSGCSRLENLPNVRHSMKHVQTLLFDGTGVNEMPNISCFIGSQDQAYGDMSFQHLGSYCSPSKWPQGVSRVSSLRRLCLSGHDFVSLHNDIGHLYNLTWLDVKQCKKLRSIPILPPRLEYFNANGCDSLETVANPLGIQILTKQIHATFNFSNCNKLDPDATDAIISYTQWKSQLILDSLSRYNGGFTLEASIGTCFPGWEVPAWFNHRTSGHLLETKLPPHWCDSKFTGIVLCAVILYPGPEHQGNRLSVKCNCEFKSKDGSRIRFSCTVGGWIEPGNTIESSHVFLGYASKLDVRKFWEENEEGCMHTDASFEFQVTDGTKKLEGYEVMKCGFSLVYASDDLQVKSGEHRTDVETNQDITSSSWVQDFFGYIFLAFSCVIFFAILSFSVIIFAPQYYLSCSDFCWPLLARILFFVAFGLFLEQSHVRKRKPIT